MADDRVRARYVAILAVALAALLPVAEPHGRWIVAGADRRGDPVQLRLRLDHAPVAPADPTSSRSATRCSWSGSSPSLPRCSPRSCSSCWRSTPRPPSRSDGGSRPRARSSAASASPACCGSRTRGTGGRRSSSTASRPAFIIAVVGGIAEVEREVRGRYIELMGGIDAIVWEQLTRDPTTLYVNRRRRGDPRLPGRELGRTGTSGAATCTRTTQSGSPSATASAVKAGREQRARVPHDSPPTGSVVWLHDRMRVEVDGSGSVVSVRGVMVDVTAQQAGRAAQRPVRQPGRADLRRRAVRVRPRRTSTTTPASRCWPSTPRLPI